MKNLPLIACLFAATSMFGCAVTTPSDEKAIRVDNAKVTHEGELSVISNRETTVSTSSLSLASSLVPDCTNICCTNCDIFTGQCEECHTCATQ
jgi:hypothetical protein